MEAAQSDLDPSFCPRILKDPVQSLWLKSLPKADRKPVCELSLALEDLANDTEIADHMMVDTLVRFVRVKKYKIPAAEKAIRAYYQWRKDYRVDERVQNWPGSEAQRLYEKYSCKKKFGVDQRGLVVVYSPVGWSDPKGYHDLIGGDNFFDSQVFEFETRMKEMRKIGAKTGVCLYDVIEIIDQTGFDWGRALDAVSAFERVAKEFDLYYPGRMRAVFLLNSPWTFNAIWKLCKLMIDDDSQAHMHTFSDDPKDYIVELTKHIDIDQIPKAYGGKSEDEFLLLKPPSKIDKSDLASKKKDPSSLSNSLKPLSSSASGKKDLAGSASTKRGSKN